jgi:D-tyrosyl-tRNA(Tyr) deacylase
MRAVIQRVQYANITINHSINRGIEKGLVVLIGIESADNSEDSAWLTGKIARLRIFDDTDGKMNLSVKDIDGEIMVVSQFTLHAGIKKGNRPSWTSAANQEIAEPIYLNFVKLLQEHISKPLITGDFGAHMDIELVNDGPVTIFIDTKSIE